MDTCGTCKFFRRGRWHKSIDPKEAYQCGGYCELLAKVLGMTNSRWLGLAEELYVQDTFGCVLHLPGRTRT